MKRGGDRAIAAIEVQVVPKKKARRCAITSTFKVVAWHICVRVREKRWNYFFTKVALSSKKGVLPFGIITTRLSVVVALRSKV